MEIIRVGMGDMGVTRAPNRLRTTGLGSCVAVVLYDGKNKIAGMAHVMLPDSSLARNSEGNPAKYADTAIPALIRRMEREGACISHLVAKLAGGAQMFTFHAGGDEMRIGPRNVEACKQALQQYRIKIVAEETGGNCGRTVEMDPETGVLQIRTVNQGIKEV